MGAEMREIKFRGRSLTNFETYNGKEFVEHREGDWVYGNLIIDGNRAYIVSGVEECNDQYISIEKWCAVNSETVGQFTGLKDTNGKEIYEGDILRNKKGEIGAVIWDEKYLMYDVNEFSDTSRKKLIKSEVIGNIHENKESLK